MNKILQLKDYGFSLDEIKSLLVNDDDKLIIAMKDKLFKMQIAYEQEKLKLNRLKSDIEKIEKGDFMKNQLEISLVETAAVNIVSVREIIAIKDFSNIMKKIFECGLTCEGYPLAIYHSSEFNPDSTDVEVGFPTSIKSDKTRMLDGGLCAKGIHNGDYSTLHKSYMEIGKWIEENGYKIAKPPYEKYINDPAVTPKQDLITEIYFPIVKI
jgi:effector-binding domain-containing protein